MPGWTRSTIGHGNDLFIVIHLSVDLSSGQNDASGLDINLEEITHHIVDRPVQSHMFLDREYVQPQANVES